MPTPKKDPAYEATERTLEAWVASLRGRSTHTARSYRDAVRRFLRETGKPIDRISVEDAMNYAGELSDSGLSRASVAHHISALRSFLRHCQSLGLFTQTPLDALKRPRVAVTSMNRYLDKDEATRLVRGARKVGPQARAAVALLLGTGLRVAELAQSEWRHLFRDPQGNLGLLVVGKGNKERVVAVREDVWSVLVAERERHGMGSDLSARDKTPLVATRDGTAPTTMTIWRWVRAAAEAASIDKPLSPHWLRHSFGTLTAMGGANVFQIQQAMGHSQITTSQRYIHWARGLDDSAAHKLPIRVG